MKPASAHDGAAQEGNTFGRGTGSSGGARAVRAVRFDNQVLGARLFAACSEADLEAAENR